MYNLGEHFKNKKPGSLKALDKVIFKGEKYRITVLTERVVRLEYDPNGVFVDYETPIIKNRLFDYPQFIIKQDQTYFRVETKYFSLTYVKEAAFSSRTLTCKTLGTKNEWYYGQKEVRNFKSCAMSLDNMKEMPELVKGLFSPEGFATIDDSKSIYLDENSNVIPNNFKNHVDLYLFVYKNDFGLCLKDYFSITGYPDMIPRYALGNWWSRDYAYNELDVIETIDKFNRNNIPLSVFLLDKEWSKKDKEKFKNVDIGFSFNEKLFTKPKELIEEIHSRNIKLGLKVNPYHGFYPFETYFEEASKYIPVNKQGYIDFNPFDARNMDLYMKLFLHPLESYGVDFFWNDYLKKDGNNELYLVNDYMYKDMKRTGKRGMLLSRNSTYAAHRYNVLYSGRTCIDWATLKLLPFYNLNSANIGVSWWSHDIAGSVGGIEDSDFYLRSVQFGVFSPILRFNTEKGEYFKREPWKWDVVTNNIATYYLRLRHKLIPYIYSEAYRYHKDGNVLVRPFYYTNLNAYDDPNYVNQYYFGDSFMISPIIEPMDPIINRTIQRFYIPEGVWYDFKNGKRFLGNHKYISFYKIEDYPIFVKTGSIIPMAGENSLMDVSNPTELEIHVFPGQSNTYHLYEDDGETYAYEKGKYLITEIDYNYRNSNYTVIIRPLEGDKSVIPSKRDYKIVFRNTKKADNVEVYENEKKITRDTSVTDSDFIVNIKNVSTSSQLVINCHGKDIEIDALMLIRDDIDSILSDLKIQTVLKDEIAKVIFDDKLNLSKKRIAIKKLKKKGLDPRSIKIFLRLLEYMEM